MQNILVPVSAYLDDANSLDYARYLALKSQAHITLLYSSSRKWLKDNISESSNPKTESGVSGSPVNTRNRKVLRKLEQTLESLRQDNINFTFKYVPRLTINGISKECKTGSYDLIVLSAQSTPGILGFVQRTYLSMMIGETDTPILMVPATSKFKGIDSITYAVDLTDYDPSIVQQVKKLATLFDAKLNIAHVHTDQKEVAREQYLHSLEKTITDTLDYPKVNYKFFDYSDTYAGITNFVQVNNTQLVAMINRKKFSWKEIFTVRSMTRKMIRDLHVPLLAFSKVSS